MTIQEREKRVISYVLIATMIIGYFWGLFFKAPTIIKLTYSLLIWAAIITYPYSLMTSNSLSKSSRLFLRILVVLGIVLVIRSVLSTDPLLSSVGNKWITLFFNEYTTFLLIPPIFVYLGNRDENIRYLQKATLTFLSIGLLFIAILEFPLAYVTTFVGAFYPYVDRKYRLLILASFIEAFIVAIISGRMFFIVLFFSLMSYILVYIIKSKWIRITFCVFFSLSPVLLALSIFTLGATQESALNVILENVADSGNEEMATDTRSFLYLEMAQDLTKNESWIWGKGAYTFFYSEKFFIEDNISEHYNRDTCEVPFLNYLMHGGLVYVFFYFGLLLMGVYKGMRSNNKFVQSISILAVGWYFISFIGDLNGCRFYHLGFFMLLGVCLSPHWRKRTDEEIVLFFEKNDN